MSLFALTLVVVKPVYIEAKHFMVQEKETEKCQRCENYVAEQAAPLT